MISKTPTIPLRVLKVTNISLNDCIVLCNFVHFIVACLPFLCYGLGDAITPLLLIGVQFLMIVFLSVFFEKF